MNKPPPITATHKIRKIAPKATRTQTMKFPFFDAAGGLEGGLVDMVFPTEEAYSNRMPQIIYCMQFKGAAAPAGGEPGVLKATTSATSCDIKTVVGPSGVSGEFHAAEGGMAYFESEVRLTAQDAFLESGTIAFGEGGHSLKFNTVGHGHLRPTPDEKAMAGTVTWTIDSGEGQFEGATGLITSNFILTNDGQVTDHHVGVIFLK